MRSNCKFSQKDEDDTDELNSAVATIGAEVYKQHYASNYLNEG